MTSSDARAMTTDLDAWRRAGRPHRWRGHQLMVWQAGPAATSSAIPLVLIHGFPTASWDWRHIWSTLARTQPVIAVDLLGFGFADKPRGHAYSVMDHADQQEAVLADLGVDRCRVLAHDYGDTVAQELLARDIDRRAGGRAGDSAADGGLAGHRTRRAADAAGLRLEAVTLLNGGLFPETHRATFTQRLLASPLGPLLARTMSARVFKRRFSAVFGHATRPSAADLDDAWALVAAGEGTHRISHRLIGYMAERRHHRARWVGALTASPVPLRAIVGAEDPISGAHMAARYRQLVPAADVRLLPGIGHYPQLEAPTQLLPLFASPA